MKVYLGWEDHLRLAANLKELKAGLCFHTTMIRVFEQAFDWCDMRCHLHEGKHRPALGKSKFIQGNNHT